MRLRTLPVRLFLPLLILSACRGPGSSSGPVAPGPFTVVVLPDTQYYTQKFPETFRRQTGWIRENARKENIAFVTHVGDVVENGGEFEAQWKVADEAMAALDGVVPWGVTIGNHDYDKPNDPAGVATVFPKHFGPSRFAGRPGFLEASPNGLNSLQQFSGGGREWLILHLEADVPDAAIHWAEEVLGKHPGPPAIVTTHIYLHDIQKARTQKPYFRKDGNSGEDLWNKLVRKQPQIVLVLCGHFPKSGEWRQVSTNDAGRKVNEVLSDYQFRTNGGDGWMRLMRFDLAKSAVSVRTYSPTLDRFEMDEDSEFTVPLDLPAAASPR